MWLFSHSLHNGSLQAERLISKPTENINSDKVCTGYHRGHHTAARANKASLHSFWRYYPTQVTPGCSHSIYISIWKQYSTNETSTVYHCSQVYFFFFSPHCISFHRKYGHCKAGKTFASSPRAPYFSGLWKHTDDNHSYSFPLLRSRFIMQYMPILKFRGKNHRFSKINFKISENL